MQADKVWCAALTNYRSAVDESKLSALLSSRDVHAVDQSCVTQHGKSGVHEDSHVP